MLIFITYYYHYYCLTVCIKSTKYVGHRNGTKSNRVCQNWASQYPHSHFHGSHDFEFPDGSVAAAQNYCRDPTNDGLIWYYTTDPNKRIEACDFKICDVNDTGDLQPHMLLALFSYINSRT